MRASYGIPGKIVDGNDVVAVYDATQEAVARARGGGGPTLIECETYRWTPHSTAGDREFARTADELAEWKQRCPVKRLEMLLLDQANAIRADLDAVHERIRAEVAAAVQWAESAPYAEPAVALENVYR